MTVRRVLSVLAVVAALGVLAAALGYREALIRPHADWSGDSIDVVLESGLAAGGMLDRLAERGVIRHPSAVRVWLRINGRSRGLHAGEYRFDRPISAIDVVRRLEAGDVLLYAVTVPEGLQLSEVADRVALAGLVGADGLRRAFADPGPIVALDPAAPDLEGYLFPDTYHFPRNVSAQEVASTFVGRFREMVGEDYPARAEAVGLSVREAVTLASMIEKETSIAGERSRISRVFHNRIARNMRMQCDPTVRYALERDGKAVERLTYRDLEYDSPWNTYVARGLPPGPIANPGRESLMAAIQPADGNELYFVAAPDGGHRFSETLEAHRKAVAEWRRYVRSQAP